VWFVIIGDTPIIVLYTLFVPISLIMIILPSSHFFEVICVLFTIMTCCHESWLSKVDFTWLILISHKVCWFCTMTSLRLIAFTWLRTCESLVDYDWLMVSWLTMVMSYDVMTFAHDSYYESWVSRMWLIWAHDRVYGFGWMERDVRSWLIRVSWWISHYASLWVIGVMLRDVTILLLGS